MFRPSFLLLGLAIFSSGPLRAAETVLINDSAPAKALIPSVANGGNLLGTSWTAESFDDASWLAGMTGVGFDATPASGGDYTALARLNVAAMQNQNSSVLIRVPFSVAAADLPGFHRLTLRIKRDDGFVAFLNGTEIAAALKPATLAWNSATLSGQGHDADVGAFEEFDVTSFLGLLHEGTNTLAIQGLNSSNTSSDLLILPQLAGSDVPPPPWPDLRFVEVPGVGPVDFPTAVRNAADGSKRLFVVERRGRIKVLYNGAISTFLDISGRVQSSTNAGDERGLLGLAFPPGFGGIKNHFYVFYTTNVSPNGGDQVLARFRLSPTVPPSGVINVANPDSQEILLRLDDPASNHNGGDLHFGPDGFLYLGLGDGGDGDDPNNRAQNPNDLWGKMIRIDVESTIGTAAPYAAPIDNPFVGLAGVRPEIWHLGLRNPWRWSFDRATGEMWIGDVGQGAYEEIDYAGPNTSGLNFGWRRFEGLHVRPGEPAATPTQITIGALTSAVTETTHSAGDTSLTGGFVYRGSRFPKMQGVYFFGDYNSFRVYGIQRDGAAWARKLLVTTPNYDISTFGEDESGELYLADLETAGANTGRIYQIGTPTDATYLTITNMQADPANRRLSFQFGAAVGKSYQVKTSNDLVTWSPVGPVRPATTWTMSFADPVDPPAEPLERFYRVDEL